MIWNRYGPWHVAACRFEAAGAKVIVTENGALGRTWRGESWYSLALGHPAGGGDWRPGGAQRWHMQIQGEYCEWRKDGTEAIVLGQRGIGPPGIAQPQGWDVQAMRRLMDMGEKVRFRPHPGERPAPDLVDDLKDAKYVVSWSSGAALRALQMGIPSVHGYPEWVGKDASIPWSSIANLTRPPKPEALQLDRATMFERLGWMIWRIPEIASGVPFRHLLG